MLRLEALLRRPHGENLLPAEETTIARLIARLFAPWKPRFQGPRRLRLSGSDRNRCERVAGRSGRSSSHCRVRFSAPLRRGTWPPHRKRPVFMSLQHRWVATWAHAPPGSISGSSSVRRVFAGVCARLSQLQYRLARPRHQLPAPS